MKYQFFTSSEKTWKAMYQSISEAKKSIYLEMYIFQNDLERFDFIGALAKKAKSGIDVKLLLDAFGSMNLSEDAITLLKKSGVELKFMSYLLHRTHRKLMIIDEQIAFIGGVNFHKSSRLWNDLVVKIHGWLVSHAMRSFIRSYCSAGGRDESLRTRKKDIVLAQVNAWVIDHSPFKKFFQLQKLYTEHIHEARKRVILITPYFIPKRWLSAALHEAVLRGIRVEVLIPKTTNHFFIDRVNYFYMDRLAKLGIVFYLEDKMNHAKGMIIDTDKGMLWSQNLDALSFDFNSEIGVFFEDKEAVQELIKIADNWKKDATIFDHKNYKSRWFDYILSPLIKCFSSIL